MELVCVFNVVDKDVDNVVAFVADVVVELLLLDVDNDDVLLFIGSVKELDDVDEDGQQLVLHPLPIAIGNNKALKRG